MKSPFKFLDAYTSDDRDVFFGRSTEIATLYDMVAKNRLILLYGQSGTGKTSLVQCGLASRFDATDWLPVPVRRHDDINLSLRLQLQPFATVPPAAGLIECLENIYLESLRPPYLIFDQLEELFILGTPEEQDRFIQNIRAILDSSIPCRIILIVREEYLAHLYGFERIVPNLFDRRLRVEPVGMAKAQEILQGSFRAFGIGVEAPESTTLAGIIDNMSGGKAGIQLPYLQVYLDMLYRREAGDSGQQAITITRKTVGELGKIEHVLEKFLSEQQEHLQAEVQRLFPGIADDTVRRVLDAFVTGEGTKRPVAYTRNGDLLQPEPRLAPLFEPIDAAALTHICRALEQSRLLRFDGASIELAHDALAALIDRQRSAAQRRLRDAHNRLLNGYREFRETGEYLSRRQLNSLEDLLPLLDAQIGPEIKTFLADSYVRAEALELAELTAERRKRRQARRVAAGGLVLSALALSACFFALFQYRAAARNAVAAIQNTAGAFKVEGKYTEAIAELDRAAQFAGLFSGVETGQLRQTRTLWEQVRQLVHAGDSLVGADALLPAIEQYRAARQAAPDKHLDNLVTQTEKELENRFSEYLLHGEALMNAKKYAAAAGRFEAALKLKPGDGFAQRRLQECLQKQEKPDSN
jgi:tetratricopeptide (TPR) repeat protein